MAKVIRLPTAAKRAVKNPVMLQAEGNVVPSGVMTRLDVPAERVLFGASKARLTDVVVVGFDADGDLYIAASNADGGDILWLLEMARKEVTSV